MTLPNAIQEVDKTIKRTLARSPKQITPITQHLLASSGQGVRARLLLIAASFNGCIHEHAIQAACSIELFHLATLVHDDIIDDSHTRRGVASVQSKFGKKHAVICGDYLFGLSLSVVADIHKPYTEFAEKFAKNIRLICLGELNQLSNINNFNLGFFDYLRTINGKTAALFHLAAFGGAIINKHNTGSISEADVRRIGRLGTYFGIIFQILDDCKDYTLDIKKAKKPTNTDIASGVINLPAIMAMAKNNSLKEKIELAQAAKQYHDIIKEISQHGVAPTIDIAKKYAKKCSSILATLPEPMVTEFEKLLNTQFCITEGTA